MKISDMILNCVNRNYLLPSIQREFVWLQNPSEQRIEKLFDSIMQEYPFGSILTWEVNKETTESNLSWEVYQFIQNYDADAPHNTLANINGYAKLFLILDGQQRLTALNLGLRGEYSITKYNRKKYLKLYINLFSNIEEDPDNNYGFKYDFQFWESTPDGTDQLWFEVGKVLDFHDKNTELFKEEFDSLIRSRASEASQILRAKITLGQLHKTICSDDTLKISPLSTSDDEKVLNVFVRTNDGGVKLQKADLLLSYMESNKDLFKPSGARREIFSFVDSLNAEKVNKPTYQFEKDDILKATLVLTNLEVQYKLKNFNRENLEKISNNWQLIKKYIDLTVKLIARYGFSDKNILSKNSLIPIAYYLMKINASSIFVASQAKSDIDVKNELIKWLVISQLTGAFGSSSDTTLKTVRDFIDKGKTFDEINLGKIIELEDVEKWINRERKGSKHSHLILLLVSPYRYWDDCHQDHIFPASKFNDNVYTELNLTPSEIEFYDNNANSIANLHLLNPLVNIAKSNDDFIEWQNTQNEDFIKSSLIPLNINLSFSNFRNFIEVRKSMLVQTIFDILTKKQQTPHENLPSQSI